MLLKSYLEDKDSHTFSKGGSPKVNTVERLEFELSYFMVAVQHFSLC